MSGNGPGAIKAKTDPGLQRSHIKGFKKYEWVVSYRIVTGYKVQSREYSQ